MEKQFGCFHEPIVFSSKQRLPSPQKSRYPYTKSKYPLITSGYPPAPPTIGRHYNYSESLPVGEDHQTANRRWILGQVRAYMDELSPFVDKIFLTLFFWLLFNHERTYVQRKKQTIRRNKKKVNKDINKACDQTI